MGDITKKTTVNNILMKKANNRNLPPKTGISITNRESSYANAESTVYSSIQMAKNSYSKDHTPGQGYNTLTNESTTQVLLSQGATPMSTTSRGNEDVGRKQSFKLPVLTHEAATVSNSGRNNSGRKHNLILQGQENRLNICLPNDEGPKETLGNDQQ